MALKITLLVEMCLDEYPHVLCHNIVLLSYNIPAVSYLTHSVVDQY